jgi:rhodanese-related sulfurtransferase
MIKMKYRTGLLMAAIILVLLAQNIPKGWSMDAKGYQNISVDQFMTMMAPKDFTLINVHIPYQGEIPQTDALIPFNSIHLFKNELPKDKDTKIVVYCMSGPMGYVAAEKLVRMGYTHVVHLQGGMRAWKKTGKQLVFRTK